MMNYFTAILCLILASGNLSAQSAPPQAFNYSGVARNASNNPIANQTIGVQLSVLKGSAVTGTIVYKENHFTNTDALGLFNLAVGTGAVQSGTFNTIDWSNDTYYLRVGLDASGGTNYVTMGSTQLLSVPYALYAKSAGSLSFGSSSNNGYLFKFNNTAITDTSINDIYMGSYNSAFVDFLTETNYRYSLNYGNNNYLSNNQYLYTTDTTTFSNFYIRNSSEWQSSAPGVLTSPYWIGYRNPFPLKVYYCPLNATPTAVTSSTIYYWYQQWQAESTVGKTYYQVYKNNSSVTGFNLTFPVNVTIQRQ